MSPVAISGPKLEKAVKPYDADWKALLPARASVASPTYIAVKITAK